MAHTVAVLERAAAYRRGLEAALTAAGFTTTEPSVADALLVTLSSAEGCAAADEGTAAGKLVVALLPEATAAQYAHALGHGAASAAAWDADPGDIVATLDQALRGWARLPSAVAAALAAEWPGAHLPRPEISEDEASWLIDLAAGHTVSRIADQTGYSERAMFRRLHELYTRLGVSGRAEAIVVAERLGLLERP